MHFLYKILLSDGRSYIGVSKNVADRFKAHRRALSEIGAVLRRQSAEVTILVCGHKEYIYDLEKKAIAAFKTRHPHGLNVAEGGIGKRGLTYEVRKQRRIIERDKCRFAAKQHLRAERFKKYQGRVGYGPIP